MPKLEELNVKSKYPEFIGEVVLLAHEKFKLGSAELQNELLVLLSILNDLEKEFNKAAKAR